MPWYGSYDLNILELGHSFALLGHYVDRDSQRPYKRLLEDLVSTTIEHVPEHLCCDCAWLSIKCRPADKSRDWMSQWIALSTPR